ncbi:MAG TPA: hypothetical protein DCY79_19230 [Planctomycetaceae bacterium]|nr:hypothetical protein [Blastopirellula sp.]HAY81941.1 hypothetical protein [Planctomycetaceae bacterium]|tara:strand:- start:1319 stop:2203 length:885 start_codon:yes stop_codon:yes gene_type:complete
MLMQRVVACCLLLLTPVVLHAQDADAPGDDQVTKGAALDDQTVMRELLAKVNGIQQSMQELAKVRTNVTANMERIGDLGNKADAQQAELTEIKQQIEELQSQFQDQVARQGEILASISSADGDQAILPLTAIMDRSSKFTQDMNDAVHRVIKTEGIFTIENKTSVYRRVFVNRVEFGVQPGATLNLKVPTGTVSTQIDGEGLKTWSVGAPSYAQKVEIVPTTESVTAYYNPSAAGSEATASDDAPTTSVTAYSAPQSTPQVMYLPGQTYTPLQTMYVPTYRYRVYRWRPFFWNY